MLVIFVLVMFVIAIFVIFVLVIFFSSDICHGSICPDNNCPHFIKGRFQKKEKKLMEFSIKLAGWVLNAPVFH